jgi:hypothetical protein
MNLRAATLPCIALSTLLLSGFAGSCGNNNNQSFNIGPSGTQVGLAIAAVGVVVVGTVVLIEVHHSHHTLKGCVLAGPNGLEIRNAEGKTYSVSGATADTKIGDLVRVSGDRQKKPKDPQTEQVFTVHKLSKDYGACKNLAATPIPPAPTPATSPASPPPAPASPNI